MHSPRNDPIRGLTLVAVAAFLGVLWVYFDAPGASTPRLVLFAGLAALALAGAAGVVAERPYVIAGAAISLFVLGLTQATLWLFVLPTAGVLGAASVLVAFHERTVVTG